MSEFMPAKLDTARKWLLSLSLVFVSIPGIIGYNLDAFGFRLGRVQPFKFGFVLWIVAQGAWLVSRYRGRAGVVIEKLRAGRWVISWAVLFNLMLILGLLLEKGGARGWSIYFALVLGQLAAVLTVLDEEFPTRWMLRGFFGAILILAFFGFLEVVFPESAWTSAFIKIFRDTGSVSYQMGSTLSTNGLAEFCVRVFPIFILVSFGSWMNAVAAFLLVAMGVLTLEKSTILSLMAIFALGFATGFGKKYWRQLIAMAAGALVILFLIQSPKQIIGRYFGNFLTTTTDVKSKKDFDARMTKRSLNERLAFWSSAVHSIEEKPLVGIGLDGFAYRNANRIPPMENTEMPLGSHSHNIVLEMAVSGGLLCAVALLGMIVSVAWLAWRANPRNWVMLIYLAGQTFSFVADARIYVSWLAITFFWFAALAWVMGRSGNAAAAGLKED